MFLHQLGGHHINIAVGDKASSRCQPWKHRALCWRLHRSAASHGSHSNRILFEGWVLVEDKHTENHAWSGKSELIIPNQCPFMCSLSKQTNNNNIRCGGLWSWQAAWRMCWRTRLFNWIGIFACRSYMTLLKCVYFDLHVLDPYNLRKHKQNPRKYSVLFIVTAGHGIFAQQRRLRAWKIALV